MRAIVYRKAYLFCTLRAAFGTCGGWNAQAFAHSAYPLGGPNLLRERVGLFPLCYEFRKLIEMNCHIFHNFEGRYFDFESFREFRRSAIRRVAV